MNCYCHHKFVHVDKEVLVVIRENVDKYRLDLL